MINSLRIRKYAIIKNALFLKLLFVSSFAFAQSGNTFTKKAEIGEDRIVKDSLGNVMLYSVWNNALMSGIGTIIKQSDGTFKFRNFSEVEKKRNDSIVQKYLRPVESPYFRKGDKFSKIKTTDMYGNKINTKSLLGKIIVINYWFINCAPCKAEIPLLNNIVDKFESDSSVVFISIALDNDYLLKDFVKRTPFNYQIIDSGKFIADKDGIRSFPTNVVIDKEGKVYFHSTGFSSSTPVFIEKAINELKNIGSPK